jgi:hypothetical protein
VPDPHELVDELDDVPFTVQQADMSFSAFFSPHLGHSTSASLSLSPRMVSKVSPQAWQRYSYRGIVLPLCFLFHFSIAFGHQKIYTTSFPKFTIIIRLDTYRIRLIHPAIKLFAVQSYRLEGCSGFRHDFTGSPCDSLLPAFFGSILDPAAFAQSGIHPQFGEDEFV